MDAVTYPEEQVIDYISASTVPLRIASNDALADKFDVQWTPTLVLLDTEGKERYRTVGFLGPAEIIPVEMLGMAKLHFGREEFDQAIAGFEKLFSDFPESNQIPEAIFFHGVAMYSHTKDPKHLRLAFDRLAAEHPGHEWTKRAYPYRLIGA